MLSRDMYVVQIRRSARSIQPFIPLGGRGSLVVKVSSWWHACHEFEPSTFEYPPSKGAMRVKSVQTSSRRCGVVDRRLGASSGIVLVT
ncbi:hypothetical protein TNCV_1071801 [Trichonephila clavipes]|nr:hypothetical protein TNCV_1071801 [Trichonephila clavipes]